MHCPLHGPGCVWYVQTGPSRGANLSYGEGKRNGIMFATAHDPIERHMLPIGDGRGDDFALGFFDGCTSWWCPNHPNGCFGRHRCRQAVEAIARGE